MIKKNLLLLSLGLWLSACSTHETAVNEGSRYLILPAPAATAEQRENERQQQMTQDWLGRPSRPALTGHVFLDGAIPHPLSRISLDLSKFVDGKWKSLAAFDSEMDGSFRVTQLIYPGSYRLSSRDLRYAGEIFFEIHEPLENLVLTLHEKK